MKWPWRKPREPSTSLKEAIEAREAAEQKMARAQPQIARLQRLRQANHVGETIKTLIEARARQIREGDTSGSRPGPGERRPHPG